MVHHGRWSNHPNWLVKELERKTRKRAEELRDATAGDTAHHDARAAPEPIHIDIEARADNEVPPPMGIAGQNDPDPDKLPDPNPETNPDPSPEQNPADPSLITPEPQTTIVATIVHIVLSGGTSTIAEFTVPTLPATVSNTALGVITIPAETQSPITVPSQKNQHVAAATENPPLPAPVAPTPTDDLAPDAPSVPVLIGASETALASEVSETSAASDVVSEAAASEATSEATSAATSDATSDATSGEQATSTSTTDATATDSSDTTSNTTSDTTSDPSTTQTTTLSTTSDSSSYTSSASTASGASSGTSSENTVLVGAPAPAPTSTGSDDTEASSSSGLPTPKLAGAVVGSIAGLAIILVILLFLLRRRKRHVRETRGAMLPDEPEQSRSAPPRPPRPMSERFSGGPIVAAGLFNRMRQSTNSESTYETSPSERGFQKISGRKIPSVLHSGGDGYGGGFEKETGGGGHGSPHNAFSFYKETGAAAGAGSGSGAVVRQDSDSSSKDGVPLEHSVSAGSASSEVAVMRPSAARVPVFGRAPANSESGYSTPAISAPSSRGEPMQPSLLARPQMGDEVGRSLHSYDSSRGSRFREGV